MQPPAADSLRGCPADADLDRAAEAAYAGAFWSAGQKCTATRRIYVEDGVYETFKETFLARIERGKVGDPTDPEVEVGPIVNESQFDEILNVGKPVDLVFTPDGTAFWTSDDRTAAESMTGSVFGIARMAQ